MYHALYGNSSPQTIISNQSRFILKWDRLNRELNKLIEFYKVLATVLILSKKVSTETLKSFNKKVNENNIKNVTFGDKGNEIEFEINEHLSIDEKRVMIEVIIDKIFIEDEIRELKYLDSAVKDILISCSVVKNYTNINLTEDLFEMHDIITSTGLYDFIIENINDKELEFIHKTIDSRITEEFRLQEIENSIGYKLESTLDIVNRKVAEALDVVKTFNKDGLNVFGEGSEIEDALKSSVAETKEDLQVVKEDSNNVIGDSED